MVQPGAVRPQVRQGRHHRPGVEPRLQHHQLHAQRPAPGHRGTRRPRCWHVCHGGPVPGRHLGARQLWHRALLLQHGRPAGGGGEPAEPGQQGAVAVQGEDVPHPPGRLLQVDRGAAAAADRGRGGGPGGRRQVDRHALCRAGRLARGHAPAADVWRQPQRGDRARLHPAHVCGQALAHGRVARAAGGAGVHLRHRQGQAHAAHVGRQHGQHRDHADADRPRHAHQGQGRAGQDRHAVRVQRGGGRLPGGSAQQDPHLPPRV
mmetsp:Transcript_22228/g.56504  ORF Transcript_22228/g.56504 Transcript_22228/m.56504 type:complete len:262 (-) Transcript_22228:1521-2306(-)